MRQSQTVAPFGVGAIFDLLGESFVAADVRWWGARGDALHLDRLARQLNVAGFRSAPVWSRGQASSRGLPFVRFPRVLFCPSCRAVVFWRRDWEESGEPARCGQCVRTPQLVPMRFVAVCDQGHMTDVPWRDWAHSTAREPAQKQCNSPNLYLDSAERGTGGLDSLSVRCGKCGARRSLNGISAKDSLRALAARSPEAVHCNGTQPWQRADQGEPCGRLLQVVQRGATNVYFANTASALDIPPESDYDPYGDLVLKLKSHPNFPAIVNAPDGPATPILVHAIAVEIECEDEVVWRALRDETTANAPASGDEDDILTGEWKALTAQPRDYHPRSTFIREAVPLLRPDDGSAVERRLDELVESVQLAVRLREVRALVSFSRYEPGARAVPADLGAAIDWRPGVEVFGEGVFIAFDEAAVSRWELGAAAVGELLEARRQRSLVGGRLPVATARYVMLHTFAHLLIRQLVFECGYSAASLQERIYSRTASQGDPQAGVLVYTAAGDVEGTMGGLVDQGRPGRLAPTVIRALERGAWCSTDPLCSENPGQGFGSLNLAACHGCCLLPETSCESGNRLLDRSLVVGNPGRGVTGFFEDVLADLLKDSRVLAVTTGER